MSKPKFINLHPKDTGFGLPRAFWGHPDTFLPNADRDGRIRRWGLSPDTEEDEDESVEGFEIPAAMMRTMQTGGMYLKTPSPEKQFVKQLEALDIAELERSDYILKITLTGEGSVKVWRRVKISGGLSLAVLADKVITPLMGWTRNYHAHLWTDFKDGSVFGPKLGWESIPEPKWRVAHILRKPGDVVEWLYDCKVQPSFLVTFANSGSPCESILPGSESNGKVEVLVGFGACPREDGKNVWNWKRDLDKLRTGSYKEKRNLLEEIYQSMNYRNKGLTPWGNPDFDPTRFDTAEAIAAIKDALSLPGSYRQGSKTWVMPLAPDALKIREEGVKGKKVHTMNTPDDGGFLFEATTGKRDGISARACSMCGTPHNLRVDTACRAVYYCSRECQTEHWKQRHKKDCKRLQKSGIDAHA
ncbi:hypothetical protein M407DRAFT_210250 [Tulasnella calospora MUT 4182]|uniref:MYND-type domain-containing protein n=1 Tax=Tulasnella calospora MUT 4182 TaxID=1051891 RepID=A0A0C3QZE0_9AGAM|nr:hypothetical protein M407DRAFT_210250 [Tulasnella calospora MUT 4182]